MALADIDWNTFYWQQLDRVYNFFRYRVYDDAIAEDLTSDTFLKALDRWESFDPAKSPVTTWLFTIARNTFTDYLRTHKATYPLDGAQIHASGPSVEQILEQQDELKRLMQMVGGLSEKEREIISLSYGAEMTNRDIAGMLNLSESNVGTIKQRAIKKMRARWEAAQ